MAKSSRKVKRMPTEVARAEPPARSHSKDGRLTVTATQAKNRFGPLLERAIQGHSVVITKHDTPKAVLLSVAEFESLVRSKQPNLVTLSEEFDSLLGRLQSSSSRRALKSAFDASPAELGRLAVAHAQRRG